MTEPAERRWRPVFRAMFAIPLSWVPPWWVLRRARAPRCPICTHHPRPRVTRIESIDAVQCRWGHVTLGEVLGRDGWSRNVLGARSS